MILAPGGSLKAIIAAVENGADSVYVGIGDFNARKGAENIDFSILKSIVDYVHLHNVEIYITLNIVFKQNELSKLYSFLYVLNSSRVDGVIIQDMAIKKLCDEYFPDINLIVSTQMNINNLYSVLYMQEEGFKQVILARELTKDEILNICENTNVKTEIFVHGAMCYAYSGLCYMSYNIGGRSGNRGECAQACRYKYFNDSKSGYFMNMNDLNLFSKLDLLKDVNSLKIEGRLKSSDYVGNVSKVYSGKGNKELLDLIFHRKYSSGHFREKGSRNAVNIDDQSKKGVFLGKAYQENKNFYRLKINYDISLGDGIFIEELNKGTILRSIYNNKEKFIKKAKKDESVFLKIRSDKEELSIFLNKTHISDIKISNVRFEEKPLIPLNTDIFLEDEKIIFEVENNKVEIPVTFKKAVNKPLDENILKKAFLKKTDQIFYIEKANINIKNNDVFLSMKELNDIRNDFFDKISIILLNKEFYVSDVEKIPKITVKIDDLNKYEYLKKSEFISNIECFYVPAEEINAYYQDIIPYFPPVLDSKFYDYEKIMLKMKDLGYSKIMAGEFGGLYLAEKYGLETISDITFNVNNSLYMDFLYERNIKNIVLSQELEERDIDLLSCYDKGKTEILVFGRRLSMISANCIEYNTGNCNKKENCRRVFSFKNERNDEYISICRDCKNYIYEKKVTDKSDLKHNSDFIRYDLCGFTIEEIRKLKL